VSDCQKWSGERSERVPRVPERSERREEEGRTVALMRLGVLASGRGSNLGALLDAEARGTLRANVALVLSDRPDAPALERARERNVAAECIDPGSRRARLTEEVEARYVEALRAHGVECVVLAGFFRIVGPTLLDAYPDRVVNIHPSLLPSFPGLDAQAQALTHGVRISGCTVHLVEAAVDAGPILAQAAVPVSEDDTVQSLSERILSQEHRILPETIHRIATHGFVREGRRIRWNREPRPRQGEIA
jgi:phosphoribosylglycinamide formyltransferase-1